MSVRIRVKGVKGLGRAFRNATGMVSEKIDKAVEKNATEMVSTALAAFSIALPIWPLISVKPTMKTIIAAPTKNQKVSAM